MIMHRRTTFLAVLGSSVALVAVPLGTTSSAQSLSAASAKASDRITGFTASNSAAESTYENAFQSGVSADHIGDMLHKLTAKPGMAGTHLDAQRTQLMVKWLRSWGLHPKVKTYYPLLSKPRSVHVSMTAPQKLNFPLKEPGFPWQKDYQDVVEGFNAYSPSANIKKPVVFVNYGLESDYQALEKLGVSVKGKIVLARYGHSFRGAKADVAAKHGAAGVLLYDDPADDGFTQGAAYPNGPWKDANAIQRGSLAFNWLYAGDPLTPGHAATKNAKRLKVSQAKVLPSVPTTPIGYGAAEDLLDAMAGPQAPKDWQGGLPLTYHLGGTGTPVVHLKIDDERSVKPVHDVVVDIRGKKTPNQRVMVGGHYDAWTYGTNDNGTGATNALEVAHSLAQLQKKGMRPDRTVEVNLWDAEEFGMMGSTEYAEDQASKLNNVVGYLNMDVAGGKTFDAEAVPSFDQLIVDASKQVIWPYTGTSVYDSWSDKVGRLGSGSDYSAYIDHFGVPTASLGAGSPGGQYHTSFDDNYTEDHFLDPGHLGQAGLTRVIGVVALRLANADVPQFDYANYATQVDTYLDGLKTAQQDKFGRQVLDLSGARQAANGWKTAATTLDQHTDGLLSSGTGSTAQYNAATSALMGNERALLTSKGLGQRSWFKHQIYATGIDSGYSVELLPGIQDAIDSGNVAQAQKYTGLLTTSLKQAAEQLRTANR